MILQKLTRILSPTAACGLALIYTLKPQDERSDSWGFDPAESLRSSAGLRAHAFGLLLRHAVQGAEAPHQIDCVNANDGATGKELRERRQRHPIERIIERRHQHLFVADVKVRVAGRQ